MPYDDRDVKKMLETQLKSKVKFPSRVTDRLDSSVKDLIHSMLEVDVTKRYNIDKVLKHPWLADLYKPAKASLIPHPPVTITQTISNKFESSIRRQTFPNPAKQIT
jgi:serine/threonine protein kinase